MKKYVIELADEYALIYEDIAKMNQKGVEDCLTIVLKKVIHTLINRPYTDQDRPDKKQ